MASNNRRFPRIDRVGESALLVTLGLRISGPLNDRVHHLDRLLRSAETMGVVDQVPAYSSLLVRFDPSVLPEEQLRTTIESLLPGLGDAMPQTGILHTIPVRYGGDTGPDLAALAQARGLSPAEVVRLHTSRAYRVYFLGFQPGFGYLGRLPRALTISRLDEPRTRVPAGSVGIAGFQTAVYPLSSPGGWRLIGQTAVRLWDVSRAEPTLLRAGDRVRFIAGDAGYEGEQRAAQAPRIVARRPVLEIEAAQGLATVQDLGRPGLGNIGLARGGAADATAAVRANALVGNPPDAAVLELTWGGPSLVAVRASTIALEGADLGCRADGTAVPQGISWFLRGGARLRFAQASPSQAGARAYLAIAGGFDVPIVLGSRSTFLPASFGGYEGRPLRAGDRLDAGESLFPPGILAGRYWLGGMASIVSRSNVRLRFTPYTGPGSAPISAGKVFAEGTWLVGAQSDRMGLRLSREDGPALSVRREVISFGVVQGAIQLPPGGNPVVLGPDHQTTGGYPLLGVVIEADWPLLAQLLPGDSVAFTPVPVEEARAALARAKAELGKGLALLSLR